MAIEVTRWNDDKPHRCPECHVVAIDMGAPRSNRVYTCCGCGVQFTRWPLLALVLPKVGIQCSEHEGRKGN